MFRTWCGLFSNTSRRKLISTEISFSSIVHASEGIPPIAVEFYFPFRTMRCFVNYDCTGQQLIDSGTVVINGERAALDLQVAEGKN